mgnify:CR=1 FL=1
MKGYIYNVDSNEIVVIIEGENNEEIEAKAEELNYMGVDEYGLVYNNNELTETDWTETVSAKK